MKKILLSAFLVVVLLSSSVYFMMPDKVRIDVEKTRTKYSVWENEWVLAATEYVNLFDGTTKMRAKSRELIYWNDSDYAYVKRISMWKDDITTIQTYTFDRNDDMIKNFPSKNEFICVNCVGKIVHYEIRDILYEGETKEIESPFSFGHNMKVEFEDAYYSKVFQQKVSDKIIIKYRPKLDYETYHVRLFDPPVEINENLGVSSTQLNTTQFGGRLITQTEIDQNYPCYLQSNGEVICPVIKKDKLTTLESELKKDIKTEINEIEKDKIVSDLIKQGIPIVDYRTPIYEVIKQEIWIDEEGKKWLINITNLTGYKTIYFNPNIENKFILKPSLNGEIKVGFNSNVFQVTDFYFGSVENVTAKPYGVVLENTHADYDSSMVGHWKFTEDATDSSGNGNDGTVTGATHNFSWYEFDGNDDKIEFSDGTFDDINYSNGFSVAFWLNTVRGSTSPLIMAKSRNCADGSSNEGWQFKRYQQRIQFETCKGAQYSYDFAIATYTNNTWVHVTGVYNPNSNLSIYINGDFKDADTFITPNFNSSNNFKIGSCDVGGYFDGSIDEVIIYNKSLSQAEITALYNKGLFRQIGNYTSGILDGKEEVNWTNINWTYSNKTTNQNISLYARTGEIAKPDFADSSLVSMWSLNQTDRDGTTAIDTMGRNNGTANGGLSLGTAMGVFQGENATEFDGVNDNIDTNYTVSALTNFSLNFWFKFNGEPIADWRRVVCNRDDSGSSQGFNFHSGGGSRSKIYVEIYKDGSTTANFNTGDINFNRWYNIVLIHENDSSEFFLDGVSKGSDSSSLMGETITHKSFMIGSSQGGGSPFKGDIAYVSIFNKSLTSEEIINWSTYTGELLIASGETLDLPVNRFLQYKAELKTNTSETPVLISVDASYDIFSNISGTIKDGDLNNLNVSIFIVDQSDNSIVGNTTSINGVWTFGPVKTGTYIVTGYDPTDSSLDGDASPHVVTP